MIWIKPPQHDFIARDLRRRGTEKPSISHPSPTSNTSTNTDAALDKFRRHSIPIRRQQTQKRRLKDRRKHDRRSQQQAVLLNTRSNQDRRQSQRRDGARTRPKNLKGIDEYC